MYYRESNFKPRNVTKLLEYVYPYNFIDRQFSNKEARLAVFKIFGWPIELEAEASILIGKFIPNYPDKMVIHKDKHQDNRVVRSAFNVPVSDNTRFEWFRGNTPEVDTQTPTVSTFTKLDVNDATLVETYNKPEGFWAAIDNWHRVVTSGSETGWMLSFRWPHVDHIAVKDINPSEHYPWIK